MIEDVEVRNELLSADRLGEPQLLGSGRTTRQILAAPEGALFVWRGSMDYVRDLARKVGRSDVMFIWVESLSSKDRLNELRGRTYPAVILDHSVASQGLDFLQWSGYQSLLTQVRT